MFVKDGKRFNIYAPVVYNGTRFSNAVDPTVRQLLGVTEITDPEPPLDYSEETYYRSEVDDPPYVVYTPKPLEQIAQVRWEKIKSYRDSLTDLGGVYVASVDKWFHSDLKSKIQIMNLRSFGQSLPGNINWKTMSGDFVLLTPALVEEIWMAHIPREMQIFAVAEQKRLDDSPVYEGWPPSFVPPDPQPAPEPEPEPEPDPEP